MALIRFTAREAKIDILQINLEKYSNTNKNVNKNERKSWRECLEFKKLKK